VRCEIPEPRDIAQPKRIAAPAELLDAIASEEDANRAYLGRPRRRNHQWHSGAGDNRFDQQSSLSEMVTLLARVDGHSVRGVYDRADVAVRSDCTAAANTTIRMKFARRSCGYWA
jgi:hypothetical protein